MGPPQGPGGLESDIGGLTFALSDAIARAGPAVMARLDDPASVQRWTDLAFGLADRSARVAVAFIEAGPEVLEVLDEADLEAWATQGRRLIGGGWKSAGLATLYFENSAALLRAVPLTALEHLVEVATQLTESSPEIAASCIREAPPALARLEDGDREPYLGLLEAVTRASWADTDRCLDRTPSLLAPVDASVRRAVLDLGVALAEQVGAGAFQLFTEAAEALAEMSSGDQQDAVSYAGRLGTVSGAAAVGFIRSAQAVRQRLPVEQERRWFDAGLDILDDPDGAERAVSWFRLESAASLEMLAALAGRIELQDVGGVLRLYAEALSGKQLLVQPRGALARRRIGWAGEGGSTTDGVSIFLPSAVDVFSEHEANFSVYKVHTTHQAARLEFGSFGFEFGVDGEFLASTQLGREAVADWGDGDARLARPPMRRYFDLFEDRILIAELFAIVEGTRIDACAVAEYPGIRRSLRRLQDHEAGQRRDVEAMPLRQAFVENLVRASLGRRDLIRWPDDLSDVLASAVATLGIVGRSGATVQDSAEASAVLYEAAASLPNIPPPETVGEWTVLDDEMVEAAPSTGARTEQRFNGDTEVPFEPPPQPPHRGEFKPELVQLLSALADQIDDGLTDGSLTREELLDLLAGCDEVSVADSGDDETAMLEDLLDNLESEARERAEADVAEEGEESHRSNGDRSDGIEWFRYDEWDFRAADYRPGWCGLGERQAEEGALGFYDETLRHYHGLVIETRRQFERMRPESFRRIRRLEDGHEIDLDEAVQFHADKKAGAGPLARFYSRRNKIDRNVAVALLLDMSASTGEAIGDAEKRIIDVEKESAVLMIEALEAIGDAYGIYGFSGEGRENVEFNVFKEIGEPLDDRVRMRIDAIEPVQSTRMGPAIRHTVSKLDAHDAKVKILILVSDGRPEDEDYGRESDERDYAVHDTRRALIEAKRLRIEPFLITVDSEGHDYLGQMCDDIGYEIVADIEALPRRLPRLYRYVASE